MDASDDPGHPQFWSTRYESGRIPWDLHGTPAALDAFLARERMLGRVLIPGCGSGYEVAAFHHAGADVTAIDFSPAAVERARQLLGPLADRIRFGDFFTHDFGEARFDLIYERTFLCALPPERWPDYVARMAELLTVGGRLVGIFVHGEADAGPPFPLPRNEQAKLFQDRFRLVREKRLPPSLPVFEGMDERWQEWKVNHENDTDSAEGSTVVRRR